MAMIAGSIWRSKEQRRGMLNGYLKEMDLLKKEWEFYDSLLQEQVGILFTSWINSKYKKLVTSKDLFYDQHEGVIQFEFDFGTRSANDRILDKNLTFDPKKVNVTIKSPLSQNIVSGLKEVMDRSDEGIWSNPFDMPVNKFLILRFYKEEVHILLMLEPKHQKYPNNKSNKSSPSAYRKYNITYFRYEDITKGSKKSDYYYHSYLKKDISRSFGNTLLGIFFDKYKTSGFKINYLNEWETKKIVKRVTRNRIMDKPFDYNHNQSW